MQKKILENREYKRLYAFLNSNNIIYNLQFVFREEYSTSFSLINITENIAKALHGGNMGYGAFVDLQKTFDTVDHKTLLVWITMGIAGFQMIGSNPICLIEIIMYP